MSLDLPANVQRDLENYARAEQITVTEAAAKFIQSGLKASRLPSQTEDLVTDEQIRQLKALYPIFGLLEDVPEDQIDRMEATIKRMKREGFPRRA